MSLTYGLIMGPAIYFGRGDEVRISQMLGIPIGIVPLILGITGLIISLIIIFKVVPNQIRQTFILAGLLGGISGYIIWLKILGPVILP